MKKIYSTFLLLFLIGYTHAQKWGLPSSRWQFVTGSCCAPPDHAFELKITQDTVILGLNCQKIGYGIYTYYSGDTVSFLVDSAFRPTYYFGAHVGDTLQYYAGKGGVCGLTDTFLYAVVDSIDSLAFGSEKFRCFHASLLLPPTFLNLDRGLIYTERLGGFGFQNDRFRCAADDSQYYILCNYGDSSISSFFVYPNATCLTTGIHDPALDPGLLLYPNPANTNVHISAGNQAYPLSISIWAPDGRLIQSDIVAKNASDMDVSSLPAGFYFVELISDERKIRMKLIIER